MSLDFDMSPYGAFVWPAFGLTAAVIGWMVWSSVSRARRWRREVERLEAERERA